MELEEAFEQAMAEYLARKAPKKNKAQNAVGRGTHRRDVSDKDILQGTSMQDAHARRRNAI
jgi:hypothetical protein